MNVAEKKEQEKIKSFSKNVSKGVEAGANILKLLKGSKKAKKKCKCVCPPCPTK